MLGLPTVARRRVTNPSSELEGHTGCQMTDESIWALADLETPWSLFAIGTLAIADRIAAGTRGIAALARESNVDEEALRRVLLHLVQRGVFAETAPDQLELTPLSRQLVGRNSGFDLSGIGGRMAGAYGTLLQVVRTGRPAYGDLFGRGFWEDLEANPALSASFDDMMGPGGHPMPSPDILLHDDWDGVVTVVDVGGGTGSLLAGILRQRPTIRATLVDRPDTVERARVLLGAAGVLDRVTLAPQSFFDPLPAGADLYVVRHVLNDWPEQEKVSILRSCAAAQSTISRVIVIGGVLPDDEARRHPDLLMLVLFGGGECGLSRFAELAGQAGLEVSAAGEAPSREYVVELRLARRRTRTAGMHLRVPRQQT